MLKLDISKSKSKLGWRPKWNLEISIDNTAEWYQALENDKLMGEYSVKQIINFLS